MPKSTTAPNGASASHQPSSVPPSSLPQFFRKPVPLDPQKHGMAGLYIPANAGFAAKTNSIAINAIEFVEAAKYYPIVFTQTDLPLPAIVVGLEQSNYFVSPDQQWKYDTYIPAYIRKYPFIFMNVPERKQFVLCIDEEADNFRLEAGKDTLPFFKDNAPTELTRHALEFCTSYHNHYLITRQFCQAIQDAGLLSPARSDSKLVSGREIQFGGFMTLDEKKVNAMPEKTLIEFFQKGWLPLIYAALISTSNWKKMADMAAKADLLSKAN